MIYDNPEFKCIYASCCPDGPWYVCQDCAYHPLNIKVDYGDKDEEDDEQ